MSKQARERVQAVLERFTEFFVPEVLDAKLYSRSDSVKTLVLITPKQFQKLAFPLSYGKKHAAKEERTNTHAGKWDELPYLKIRIDTDSEEALVFAHEGRHRTIYMHSRDLTKIPVMFWVERIPVKEMEKNKLYKDETHRGDKLVWGQDAYRPKVLRSQNMKWVMPMPHSVAYPKLE